MALLTPQTPGVALSTPVTMATPSSSDTAVPGINVWYVVRTTTNADNVTVVVPGATYGQNRPDIVHALGTNVAVHMIGPLVPDLADPTTGLVTITHSATTGVTAALVNLSTSS